MLRFGLICFFRCAQEYPITLSAELKGIYKILLLVLGWFQWSLPSHHEMVFFFQDISSCCKIWLWVEICCRHTSTGSVCLFSREICSIRDGKQSKLIWGTYFWCWRFRWSRHSLKLQEGKNNVLEETCRTAVEVLVRFSVGKSQCSCIWKAGGHGQGCQRRPWGSVFIPCPSAEFHWPSAREWGWAEPSSELLAGLLILPWSWTTSLCDFVEQQHIQKTDSSSCDGKIFSLCVFIIVCSSLKCTQLFAFMFINYCNIYSIKTCCFIHHRFLTLIPWPFIFPVVYPELLNGFAQIRNFFFLLKWWLRQEQGNHFRCAPHHICIV